MNLTEVKSACQPKVKQDMHQISIRCASFSLFYPTIVGLLSATFRINPQFPLNSDTTRKPDPSNAHQNVNKGPDSSQAGVLFLCKFASFISRIRLKQHRQVNGLSSKRGGHI
ncbi:hypothetical protein CHARACLAT_000792 [Characodon lateralis]|uniref:Uncharacterized protein n=1 Tax=Characodon lateralis TaxID=208331 RepID=A0ABU7D3R7_9TELE|nr:hypothetical protein [Characodon lateralis]